MINVSTKFQNNSSKSVAEVRNTKLPIFCLYTNGKTDGRTDKLIMGQYTAENILFCGIIIKQISIVFFIFSGNQIHRNLIYNTAHREFIHGFTGWLNNPKYYNVTDNGFVRCIRSGLDITFLGF